MATGVLCALYFLESVILPVAVAALITFVLSPAVSWLEKRMGRTLAIVVSVAITFIVVGVFAWITAVQILELAWKLPTYKANLTAKMQALNSSSTGPFAELSQMFQDIERHSVTKLATAPALQDKPLPMPVEVIENPKQSPGKLLAAAGMVFLPLGSVGVIVILAIFMLFKRDDLRDRIIGLIGKGHIGETTGAMRDAAKRVNQFLRMNLLVNVTYGVPVAVGLYFIGVPSAALWGVVAIILRFIPYLGPLIAMAFPIGLSLAVFDNWTGPLLTIGLFVVLELISNNVIEPWLYGSSTGISSFALIVAALFWTWLWGSAGLVLSTPLTVCLLVMGKNVPQLSFLGVLLSEEAALAPHEMCYHRLLAADRAAINRIVEEQARADALEFIYSTTLLPALALVEDDFQRRALDQVQHESVIASLREVVDELDVRLLNAAQQSSTADNPNSLDGRLPQVALRIVCVPAESAADEVSAAMLAQAARAHQFHAEAISSKFHLGEIRSSIAEMKPDWVWICAVNPTGVSRCRHLCMELRKQDSDLRISIGIWHPQEHITGALDGLKQAGAESVSTVFGEALLRMEALRASFTDSFVAAPVPDNEAERLAALVALGLANQGRDELFDRTTAELTKIFEVPIALVSIVDSGWQHFASQCGLPSDLAEEGRTARDVSVCGHVVAANRPFVIEDLARDPRFAGNPLLRQRNLRFYAGVPLRTNGGLAVGSLCILDTRPRTMSDREIRLMQMIAEGLMLEIEARASERTEATPADV